MSWLLALGLGTIFSLLPGTGISQTNNVRVPIAQQAQKTEQAFSYEMTSEAESYLQSHQISLDEREFPILKDLKGDLHIQTDQNRAFDNSSIDFIPGHFYISYNPATQTMTLYVSRIEKDIEQLENASQNQTFVCLVLYHQLLHISGASDFEKFHQELDAGAVSINQKVRRVKEKYGDNEQTKQSEILTKESLANSGYSAEELRVCLLVLSNQQRRKDSFGTQLSQEQANYSNDSLYSQIELLAQEIYISVSGATKQERRDQFNKEMGTLLKLLERHTGQKGLARDERYSRLADYDFVDEHFGVHIDNLPPFPRRRR